MFFLNTKKQEKREGKGRQRGRRKMNKKTFCLCGVPAITKKAI
jgi:hypothetical protein